MLVHRRLSVSRYRCSFSSSSSHFAVENGSPAKLCYIWVRWGRRGLPSSLGYCLSWTSSFYPWWMSGINSIPSSYAVWESTGSHLTSFRTKISGFCLLCALCRGDPERNVFLMCQISVGLLQGLCLLSQHGAPQLYCTVNLHPSRHPVTAAVLRTVMKETRCIYTT